jgi:hypothetical protein
VSRKEIMIIVLALLAGAIASDKIRAIPVIGPKLPTV